MTTRSSHEPSPRPAAGIVGDLKRAHRDGSASLSELRDFVGSMRGRSPQEVLGMVSASELIRGVALATFGCALFIAAFTIGPYMLRGEPTAKKPVKAAPVADQANTKTEDAVAANAETNSKAPSDPDLDAAAKALDIDEVKSAPPDVNPLDKELDALLDGKE